MKLTDLVGFGLTINIIDVEAGTIKTLTTTEEVEAELEARKLKAQKEREEREATNE